MQHKSIFAVLPLLAAALALSSCGSKSDSCRIEGRFRNFNQGDIFLYDIGAGYDGFDTLHVADSRFAQTIDVARPATLLMVFPNYSEQVVFVEPGADISVKGDASHLKAMDISGTDDNELMTEFRERTANMTPPEVRAEAESLAKDHPESPVALYVVERYMVRTATPDWPRAAKLLAMVAKARPDDARAARLAREVKLAAKAAKGQKLPKDKELGGLKGKVKVVCAWATWSYDSQMVLRRLKQMQRDYKGLAVLSICLDAKKEDCDRFIKNDSIPWKNIRDGRMWDTPLLRKLGICTVPGNVVADESGKIIARGLNSRELEDLIRQRK